MPTLNWIGKDKVVNHHLDVPYRVLNHQYGFTASEGQTSNATESGNKIIHGDNLEALKALLPEYEGRIKCVYIDPPYNTGNQTWIYNDNVDDPKIRKWLGDTVGKEGEDLSRHDKWLCMMYPRLKLLHKLLAEDGLLVTSIDENEYSNLKLILDEIFGRANLVGTVVWKNATDNNPTNIAIEHEYIIIYALNKKAISPIWKSADIAIKNKLIDLGENLIRIYDNDADLQVEYTRWLRDNKPFIWPFQDYKFIDRGGIFTGSRSVHNPGKEGYRYDVIHPDTRKPCQQPMMGYRFPYDTMQDLLEKKKIIFGEDENKIVEIKLYVKDYRAKLSSLLELDGRIGTNNIKEIFPESNRQFDYPKPYSLIEEILSFITTDSDIILDSFAGSGTTAHSVFNLNKQDGGNRKVILIEMEEYAETITAERVKRVIKGYGQGSKMVDGIGGEFDYYTLGEPLFDEFNNLNESVGLERISEYVWYSETRSSYSVNESSNFLLGKKDACAYYFYYLADSLTELDFDFLSLIDVKADQYVIYADNCLLTDEFMQAKNIIFKKIPRDITRF